MGEEVKKEVEPVDYKKIGDIIDSAVAKKIDPLDQKILELKNKQVEEAEEEESEDPDFDAMDDDDVLTKKDVVRLLKNHSKVIDTGVTEKIKNSLTESANKATQDTRVFKDFPMLDQDSHLYDSEFEKQTRSEISKRKQAGRSVDDPYLIYDAASTVFAQNPGFQKKKLENNVSEFQRTQNNRDNNFTMQGRSNSSNTATASQVALAEKLGWNAKGLNDHLKKRSKV